MTHLAASIRYPSQVCQLLSLGSPFSSQLKAGLKMTASCVRLLYRWASFQTFTAEEDGVCPSILRRKSSVSFCSPKNDLCPYMIITGSSTKPEPRVFSIITTAVSKFGIFLVARPTHFRNRSSGRPRVALLLRVISPWRPRNRRAGHDGRVARCGTSVMTAKCWKKRDKSIELTKVSISRRQLSSRMDETKRPRRMSLCIPCCSE